MKLKRPVKFAALAFAAVLSVAACGGEDSETPNPDGGAVTVPDQSQPGSGADGGAADGGTGADGGGADGGGADGASEAGPDSESEPTPEDTGAETVRPEVEGIGMDEASQIALDEFGGELDSIESDHFDGIPVWEVELENTDLGYDLEVMVDKETGEILHYEED